ncbi:MAG: aminotransferase class III-fold pyridoxal phosphate-dependent enzyme, partial [Lentisphaeria bacterium]|nr:aminotransferase class III-fold pyridoxal phosphate-dependent enzyme [Lentisphaeria bacterium]
PYNDLASVKEIVDNLGDDLAAIIVEPIAGNMGLIEPLDGFLQGLKDLTQSCGALLIFDEVINGFRLGPTTYGQSIGIEADITTLGKLIGGGIPIGAFVAKKEIMDHLSPLGDVYQAGTLSGNPVAVATGLKTLQILEAESPYGEIDRLGAKLEADTRESLASIGAHIKRLGGVFTLFFAKGPLTNLDDVQGCDFDRFKDFYHKMLAAGIYLPPSQYECAFISAAHTEADVDVLIAAINAYTP